MKLAAPPFTLRDPLEAGYRAFLAGGDPRPLAALYDELRPYLVRYAGRQGGSPEVAEDAVQDAFLDLLARRARPADGRPLLPWLLGVVRNKALKERRRMGRRPDQARLCSAGAGGGGSGAAEAPEGVLDALEEPYRSAARLRWSYGLSPQEIAVLRGEPSGTTRSLLARAVLALRRTCGALAALLGVGALVRWLTRAGRAFASPLSATPTAGAGLAQGTACVAAGCALGLAAHVTLPQPEARPSPSAWVALDPGDDEPSGWGWIHHPQPTLPPGSEAERPAAR